MDVFLLTGKDPNDEENPVKTWIVVANRERDAGCDRMDGRAPESLMAR